MDQVTLLRSKNKQKNMPDLKILFISHEFGIGGATKSLVSLIKGIEKLNPNVKCKVLVPFKYGKKSLAYKYLDDNDIDYQRVLYRHNYKRKNEGYSAKYFFYDLINCFAVGRIARLIMKGSYDFVCTNSTAVSVGGEAAIRCNTPHIQYIRERMEEDFSLEYRNKQLMKNIFEKSTGVVFISNFVKEKYIPFYDIKSDIVFSVGINIDEYYCNQHILFSNDVIKILQAGAFKDGKGTKDTIEIMNILHKKGFDKFTLDFVGDGEKKYIEEMKELISKYGLDRQIKIHKYTRDIKSFLNDADVFIMNSVAEGFGRVTVEAMAAGCIVLGKDAGGTREIITDEITGVLFQENDDAANKIIKIVSEKERYIKIAKEGQCYSRENYSEAKTSEKFLDYCLMQL